MTAMNSCVWPWDSLHFTEQCEKPHPSNLQICLSLPPSPDINRDQVLLHNSTVKHCFVFFFFFKNSQCGHTGKLCNTNKHNCLIKKQSVRTEEASWMTFSPSGFYLSTQDYHDMY